MAKDLVTGFTTVLHRYARVAVFAGIGVVIGGCSMYAINNPLNNEEMGRSEMIGYFATSTYARSAPTHIHIEKINLDADFEAPLGLQEDQTVEVPKLYTTVGWYKNGATPGEVGTAVILGHVDSYQGPAVFHELPKLKKGDRIEIQRQDGTTASFSVDEVKSYSRENFPTELVYGKTDTPTLRLITCTGTFNHGKQEYSHNLVVYASLITNQK